MQSDNFTQGSIVRGMLRFSVPYLITCFLQTFYGMADLFIVGQFNEAASITAVSVGSQLMHMLTVVIAGFAMGSTVLIGRSVGAGNRKGISAAVSTTFAVFAPIRSSVCFRFPPRRCRRQRPTCGSASRESFLSRPITLSPPFSGGWAIHGAPCIMLPLQASSTWAWTGCWWDLWEWARAARRPPRWQARGSRSFWA